MAESSLRARALDTLIGTINRIPGTARRLELVVKPDPSEPPEYAEDGLVTRHAHRFVEDARFQRAYDRAIRASGLDYGIRWRAHCLLWAAQAAAAGEGAYVECGTGHGFMMSAVCEYLDWQDRPLYLFDSFKATVPDASGTQAPDGKLSPVYTSDTAAVAENFAEWPGVQIVAGDIPGSFADVEIDTVAFLHVDLNHALPEEAAVRHFWPRLVPGAVMVLDDYGFPTHDDQRDMHDRLADEFGYSILVSPTGQGLVVKR